MLHRRTYFPGARSRVRSRDSPTGTSSTSPVTSTPSPSSLTAPVDSVGSEPAPRSVLRTTNSCVSSGPVLLMLNVTGPAGTVAVSGRTAHSCRPTATVVAEPATLDAAAADVLGGADPPPAAHAATTNATENRPTAVNVRISLSSAP